MDPDDLAEAWRHDELSDGPRSGWPADLGHVPEYRDHPPAPVPDDRLAMLRERARESGSADAAWSDRLSAFDAADDWQERSES